MPKSSFKVGDFISLTGSIEVGKITKILIDADDEIWYKIRTLTGGDFWMDTATILSRKKATESEVQRAIQKLVDMMLELGYTVSKSNR